MIKKHNTHDSRYKKLFSNRVLTKELLLSFVDEPWVRDLDYNTLEKLDKSFVTEEFINRESDIIYKINYSNNELYIYLLIEFQSTVDRFMSLRILRYISEFYEYLISLKKFKKLPAVFPVMLYNGKREWTAPVNLVDLIEQSVPLKYIPNFSYYKISENEFSKDILLGIKNIVSAIFYLENNNLDEVKKNIDAFINLIKNEKPEEIKLFKLWLKNYFHGSDNIKSGDLKEKVNDLEEVKDMLSLEIKRFKKEQFQLGVEKGIQKGINKGKLEIARLMFEKGIDEKTIFDITGLKVVNIEKKQ